MANKTPPVLGAAFTNGSDAKGIEKILYLMAFGVYSAQTGLDVLLYGKPAPVEKANDGAPDDKTKYDPNAPNKRKKFKNPLDKGLVYILNQIANIDFCNILTYAASKAEFGKKKNTFDPTKRPQDGFALTVWKVKNAAYKMQISIDSIYDIGEDVNGQRNQAYEDITFRSSTDVQEEESDENLDAESKKKKRLFRRLNELRKAFDELKKEIAPELNEIQALTGVTGGSLLQTYPPLKKFFNQLDDKMQFLNQWTDYRQIPVTEYQKILRTVDKVRTICTLIIGLSSPKDAFNAALNFLPASALAEIERIDKIIPVDRIIPTLRNMLATLQKVNAVIIKVLQIINLIQIVVKVVTAVVKIFVKVKAFFLVLPIPNAFTTVGVTSLYSDTVEELLKKKGITNLFARLSQAEVFLGLLFNFCKTVATEIENVIRLLRLIIANMQACSLVEPDLIRDLNSQTDQLQRSLDQINDFVRNKENRDNNASPSTFSSGGYSIRIITEEVIEEAFTLRRRYGIALDSKGLVVATSAATFASDDNIIKAEVIQLLRSKKLIKFDTETDFTADQKQLIETVNSYLLDDNINWDASTEVSTQLDSPNNENDAEGLGLNSFMNKLPGGKALRKRTRAALQKNLNQFRMENKSDANGTKISEGLLGSVKSPVSPTGDDDPEVKKLQDEKATLIDLIAKNPRDLINATRRRRIAEIDAQLKKLTQG